MAKVRDYFNEKYDKQGPAYMQGVLRTLDRLPEEDEEVLPAHDKGDWEDEVGVVEK